MTALFFSLLLVAGASAQMLARFDALGEQPFFRQPKLKAPRPHMSSRMRSPMSAPGVNVAYDAGPAAMKSYAKKRIEVADSLDAGHLRNYVQQPYLEHDTGNDCSAFPNNTRKHPHIFSCPTGTELLAVHDAAVTNSTGDDHYPVDFSSTVRFFLDVTSYATRRFDNVGVEVSLYKRSTGWFGCGWLFIPSFGLLSNYRMCEDNPSCPIVPGRQVLEITVDPSNLFNRFFRMFHEDQAAYQLVLRVRHNVKPYENLLCATIQTRIHL